MLIGKEPFCSRCLLPTEPSLCPISSLSTCPYQSVSQSARLHLEQLFWNNPSATFLLHRKKKAALAFCPISPCCNPVQTTNHDPLTSVPITFPEILPVVIVPLSSSCPNYIPSPFLGSWSEFFWARRHRNPRCSFTKLFLSQTFVFFCNG